MSIEPHPAQVARLEVVDLMRGLAVVLMIAMHTAEGWLVREAQAGLAWEVVRLFGGLAAPLFLLVSGIALGVGWSAPGAGPRVRLRAGVARGLQVVVLGYALRVQMWMLDAGGYRTWDAWIVAGLLIGGYAALHLGLSGWASRRPALAWLSGGLTLASFGVVLLVRWVPERVGGVFRVDVLQTIGVSVVLVSLLGAWIERGGLGEKRVFAFFLSLAAMVGLGTSAVRAWVPGPLPTPLAAYLASWPPATGALPAGLFPLFPWLAYPLVGAAVGLAWGRRARAGTASRIVIGSAFVGAALALATYEAIPVLFAFLEATPWLVPTFRAACRIGLGFVAGGLCLLVFVAPVPRLRSALGALGRASLLVYWVHLELVYGPLARPLLHRLSIRAWSGWAIGLLVVMIALAFLAAGVRRRRGKDDNFGPSRTSSPTLARSVREAL